ncbi:iron-sulfur cluster co-chaperone protein HscB isoform X2 [Pithys albifrons albifrons]|uniref:iron-sulfur cluster co-chaperone protein HscB isoform X2 n=1 Tax=Pithys albifrons albifrons TaxID=3385563 RepID=UPI003A5CBF0A
MSGGARGARRERRDAGGAAGAARAGAARGRCGRCCGPGSARVGAVRGRPGPSPGAAVLELRHRAVRPRGAAALLPRLPGPAAARAAARPVPPDGLKEQHYSEQHSSLINKAYQTLLNPLSRGLYLLELSGVELAQETDCDADSAFLMEIMEINEKLAEPKNEDSFEEIETLIKVKQEELTREVTAAFERDDLQEAKKLLGKMKYFANLEDKLKSKKIPS